jgi:flagellar basal-body rod protein FlgF
MPWIYLLWAVYLFALSFCNTMASCHHSLALQLAAKKQLEILTNNFANRSTAGFIEQAPYLTNVKAGKAKHQLVSVNSSSVQSIALKPTGRELDIAIKGEGFFKLLLSRGYGYTLNGGMYLNSEGMLVNSEGFPFLDSNDDPIVVPSNAKQICVAESGNVIASFENGKEVLGRIGVFLPLDNSLVTPCSGGVYSFNSTLSEEYNLISGSLAQPNIDLTTTLSALAEQQRAFDESASLMHSSIQLDKTALELISK